MAEGTDGMSMRVLTMLPPNFAAINRAFGVRGKPVIYAYGNTIYNPARILVHPSLVQHELVHSRRQGDDPAGWWDQYIADKAFRLAEEIPAHQAEYASICRCRTTEAARAEDLNRIAERLASPLYGGLIGIDEAKRLIGHVEEGASGHAISA